ncbi:rhomboid domain-containing protein 3 [Pungitius pungitius]|uniref:rhomboid domain-containing protein 3 n=1 Tax=Pungitius pungitius TaxID=134920 RepID=UPI00188923A0|nr:rhomboid domain-containing protein 3 [Pungitius pungitius]
MLHRVLPAWFWFGSDRAGYCLGTCVCTALALLTYAAGVQASLTVGPGGDFPRLRDVLLYAFSHDELPSLLVSVALLLMVGPSQERRWGTVAFLLLSILTATVLPLLYTLLLFVGGAGASRICGYSAIQLALFAAQCRQVAKRRLLRCLPVWFLPWLLLLAGLLLLPGTPALLHFCAILIGHNYAMPFIGILQELEEAWVLDFIPDWVYVRSSARLRLPFCITSQRSRFLSPPEDKAAAPPMRDQLNHHPWEDGVPAWIMNQSAALSEAEVLEEQMLKAGILASLQNDPDHPDSKVEVAKSSVSSLRLQQLEKMGFPTDKAVVALAASKQLDGAISLLIDDSVGEQAVVVSKGKTTSH